MSGTSSSTVNGQRDTLDALSGPSRSLLQRAASPSSPPLEHLDRLAVAVARQKADAFTVASRAGRGIRRDTARRRDRRRRRSCPPRRSDDPRARPRGPAGFRGHRRARRPARRRRYPAAVSSGSGSPVGLRAKAGAGAHAIERRTARACEVARSRPEVPLADPRDHRAELRLQRGDVGVGERPSRPRPPATRGTGRRPRPRSRPRACTQAHRPRAGRGTRARRSPRGHGRRERLSCSRGPALARRLARARRGGRSAGRPRAGRRTVAPPRTPSSSAIRCASVESQ